MGEEQFVRDTAVMALIFGMAAFSWFGWGQEDPPRRWRLLLGIGSGLGLVLAVVGGLLTWQNWGPGSVLADPVTRQAFGIVCGIEFGVAGLGAAMLGRTGRARWIAAWIAFVVGVHFVPLGFVFRDAGLFGLAAALVVASVVAVVVHLRAGITPSAVVGAGSGAALLAYAVRAAVLVAAV